MSNDTIYFTKNFGGIDEGKTLLTGIREVTGSTDVYISGFYKSLDGTIVTSFVYKGGVYGCGVWYQLNYPRTEDNKVTSTNLYGPNNGCCRAIQVVGNYTNESSGNATIGCLYEGYLDGSGKWTTIIPTSPEPVLNTICHSTMGGLVVGNYDTSLKTGRAFIYDICTQKYTEIVKGNAKSITAYGIWHNSYSSYTICGGFTNIKEKEVDAAYLVDWNNKKQTFSNWREFSYKNNSAIVTHFDGITGDGNGGYNLTGDQISPGSESIAFFANVKRHRCCSVCKCADRSFSNATWKSISYPRQAITSGNSVCKNMVIGVYTSPGEENVNGYISIIVNK